MPELRDGTHSLLIVSGSEAFDTIVRKSLPGGCFMSTERRGSAAAARQMILGRYYDLVVINSPLPDASGIELALDITEQCSACVMIVTPRETYEEVWERVAERGILVLYKPIPKGRLGQMLRYLLAIQSRMHQLESRISAAEEKTEELRIVTRAKFLLVEKKHMSEDEAHHLIGKEAMNRGISRRRAAERIIDDLE